MLNAEQAAEVFLIYVLAWLHPKQWHIIDDGCRIKYIVPGRCKRCKYRLLIYYKTFLLGFCVPHNEMCCPLLSTFCHRKPSPVFF